MVRNPMAFKPLTRTCIGTAAVTFNIWLISVTDGISMFNSDFIKHKHRKFNLIHE